MSLYKLFLIAVVITIIALFFVLPRSAASAEVTPVPVPEVAPPPAPPQTVEQYVRQEFADVPVMVMIARCESRFRQFDAAGRVLKNPHSSASGVFQVMASIHAAAAKRVGMDIATLKGNVAYARYLFETQGTVPWNDSKYCWGA